METEYRGFAVDLARRAQQIIATNFRNDSSTTLKDNLTPVTDTDLTINQMVIDAVTQTFPAHAVIGEEQSRDTEHIAEWAWACDPLDGTIPFVHGMPICTFALALVHDGEPILGVIVDPFSDRLYYAEKGSGATVNGEPLAVSSTSSLQSRIVEFSPVTWDKTAGISTRQELTKSGAIMTAIYSNSYASMLVASGKSLGVIYPDVNAWDGAAASIIVSEAGGKVTDLTGQSQRYDRPINGFIASNGLVHDELIKAAAHISNTGTISS